MRRRGGKFMRHKVRMLVAVAMLALAFLASCSRAPDLPPTPSTMSARALQAGCLAFQEFSGELRGQPTENDFQKFASSTDNYDVVFRESEKSFSFTFRIKPYQGRRVFDGVSTFEVDKVDLKVIKTRSL
jgi:hypothetical protein